MLRQQIFTQNPKKKLKLLSEENCYKKQKLIGQGTFGKVFLAIDSRTGNYCAIKSVLQDKKYKNRQLSIVSRLNHSNIIHMNDYYFTIEDDNYYLNIVMDYMNDNLQRILKQNRKIKKSIDSIHRKIISFQLFKGLYYLQLNRVCHRDLKPPNILINNESLEVKICDFGSAKFIQKGQQNVSYICSRYYRAPQLIFGVTNYSSEIDMWSLGCIIVQLLTLDPIFPGDSSIEQLIQIVKVLGTPCQNLLHQLQTLEINLPKIDPTPWHQILQKYQPQEQLVDLIQKMLVFDSKNRISPYEAMMHPYFKKLVTYEKQLEKLPQLLNFKSLETAKNKFEISMLQKIYERSLEIKKQNGISMGSTFCAQ